MAFASKIAVTLIATGAVLLAAGSAMAEDAAQGQPAPQGQETTQGQAAPQQPAAPKRPKVGKSRSKSRTLQYSPSQPGEVRAPAGMGLVLAPKAQKNE